MKRFIAERYLIRRSLLGFHSLFWISIFCCLAGCTASKGRSVAASPHAIVVSTPPAARAQLKRETPFTDGHIQSVGTVQPGGTESGINLGQEYEDYAKYRGGKTGSKVSSGGSGVTARSVALYLPNRVLDFLDIFHVDVGAGPAYGAALRVTRYGQVGYRQMAPMSVRVGLRGRRLPVFVERTNEFGAGPSFEASPERTVSPGELGVGVDLFIVGAYAGVSFDQFADFVLGWFGIDFTGDDLR